MPQTLQTFLSPNFYDREIDLSGPAPQGPVGVPAGVIGTANQGPAFVPVTVGNFDQFIQFFGTLDPNRYGPYAAYYFLANRSALTFMRILGAGANASGTDIQRTLETGRTLNAGFHLDGSAAYAYSARDPGKGKKSSDALGRTVGNVQFLAAKHTLQPDEAFGPAIFTDNSSFSGQQAINLVRGMVMLCSGARLMVTDGNHDLSTPGQINGLLDFGVMTGGSQTSPSGYFKLIISSALGSTFYNDDGNPGCHIITASFDPDDINYYAKLLNGNPDNFVQFQHYLYADFAVDDEIATPSVVAVLSGTSNISTNNPDVAYSGNPYDDNTAFLASYGAFDTRYQTPSTTNFISQPFGNVEYDLFAIEALDDGQYANNLFKISIVNIQASTTQNYLYGTFSLQVRSWTDTDINPNVLEQWNNLSLDPNSDQFIGAVIGDRKVYYNFDASNSAERRLVAQGKYANQSAYIRVVPTTVVYNQTVPAQALPFGFRGLPVLKTNDNLNDFSPEAANVVRINGVMTGSVGLWASSSILPPVPFRSKVTKGNRPSPAVWFGEPSSVEQAYPPYYWGVQFERLDIPLNPNIETLPNALLKAYTQFFGAPGLDNYVTGSGADTFSNNKFTLAKVAFSNDFNDVYNVLGGTGLSGLTASIDTSMKEAAYIRNAVLNGSTYTYQDPAELNSKGTPSARITFATLLGRGTPQQFNRFAPYLKFTTFMFGGWDGVNFLDPDARRMNDKASSFDDNTLLSNQSGLLAPSLGDTGGAFPGFVPPGMSQNMNGTGQANSTVSSYVAAVNVMTDPMQVNHNILCIPGIREPFLTDYAGQSVKTYGLAYYVMDLENYDELGNRLFDNDVVRPDVNQTATGLNTRAIDNNYIGTYFPDVFIQDTINNRRIKVPSSIAAMGALGFNDKIGYPWFAPAGFNRAALDFVTNVAVRLNSADRDTLYTSRINPIATFPKQGFVIFGQKTLQAASSALDRVNVRRLLLEVKRIIIGIALKLEFEQNTIAIQNNFTAQAVLQLGLIQTQAGIEAFQVICNSTNNSQTDIDQYRMNGRIVVVPTRVVEFIAIDFIITNSGVQFV
jgi:hypothetical protein